MTVAPIFHLIIKRVQILFKLIKFIFVLVCLLFYLKNQFLLNGDQNVIMYTPNTIHHYKSHKIRYLKAADEFDSFQNNLRHFISGLLALIELGLLNII